MRSFFKEMIQTVVLLFLVQFPASAYSDTRNIIKYDEEAKSAYFIADMSEETVQRLINLHTVTKFETIVITSPGGEFDAGIMMANFINENQLKIIVNRYCNSSCTIPFFTTPLKSRFMTKGSTLGLHNVTIKATVPHADTTYITVRQLAEFTEDISTKVGLLFILYASNKIPFETLLEVSKTRGEDVIVVTRRQLVLWGALID